MSKNIDWEEVALRRAEFLLSEARSRSPVRDQTVTFALRVISNWATIGKDASSSAIKWLNPRVSKKAMQLYHEVSDREWERLTINEHQEPISHVWKWILDNNEFITARDILDRAKQWPMVTITKDEDYRITKAGHRSSGRPEDRHAFLDLCEQGPPKRRVLERFKLD